VAVVVVAVAVAEVAGSSEFAVRHSKQGERWR